MMDYSYKENITIQYKKYCIFEIKSKFKMIEQSLNLNLQGNSSQLHHIGSPLLTQRGGRFNHAPRQHGGRQRRRSLIDSHGVRRHTRRCGGVCAVPG